MRNIYSAISMVIVLMLSLAMLSSSAWSARTATPAPATMIAAADTEEDFGGDVVFEEVSDDTTAAENPGAEVSGSENPVGNATGEEVSGESNTGTPASATPKRMVASKADIRVMLETGEIDKAEAAYLDWASYWRDDDPALIVAIERAVLLKQYTDGNFTALLALVQAGDREAVTMLRSVVVSGGKNLPAADFATAIRIIGKRGDRSAINTLRLALYHEDKTVANAAIEALGDMGDKRIVSELMKLFDNEQTDLERSIVLARALKELGAANKVRVRFQPQLRFPMEGAREKASLILAAMGYSAGWSAVVDMLEQKKDPYYPLALTVLGARPSAESREYVIAALAGGSEAEQLAALHSLECLPAGQVEQLLLQILREKQRPVTIRQAAINKLTARQSADVVKELQSIATSLRDEDPKVRYIAMTSLPAYGLLEAPVMREMVRQRFVSIEDSTAEIPRDASLELAARAALLSYAMDETGKKPGKQQ